MLTGCGYDRAPSLEGLEAFPNPVRHMLRTSFLQRNRLEKGASSCEDHRVPEVLRLLGAS